MRKLKLKRQFWNFFIFNHEVVFTIDLKCCQFKVLRMSKTILNIIYLHAKCLFHLDLYIKQNNFYILIISFKSYYWTQSINFQSIFCLICHRFSGFWSPDLWAHFQLHIIVFHFSVFHQRFYALSDLPPRPRKILIL